MGCCKSKAEPWDLHFKETELSSNRCDAYWENVKGDEATFGMAPHFTPCTRFGMLPGVLRVRVGFCGGTTPSPSYEDVGDHTLAVNVHYDPKRVKYEQLLHVFWNYHDIFSQNETPETQSTIFYHNRDQEEFAQELMAKEQAKHDHVISTVIRPFKEFINSDDEHQHFILQSNPDLMKVLGKRLRPHQMAHSHLACRLEGYVAGFATPAEFDKELSDLHIPEQVAHLVRRLCEQNQIPEPGTDHMNDWG